MKLDVIRRDRHGAQATGAGIWVDHAARHGHQHAPGPRPGACADGICVGLADREHAQPQGQDHAGPAAGPVGWYSAGRTTWPDWNATRLHRAIGDVRHVPNQDVVCGLGFFSLDEEPVVAQVPDLGTRLWVYALYDGRTDQFGQVGKPYNTKPGFYLLVGPKWEGGSEFSRASSARQSNSFCHWEQSSRRQAGSVP